VRQWFTKKALLAMRSRQGHTSNWDNRETAVAAARALCLLGVRSEPVSMFDSTTPENFESWSRFLDAYYEPIRVALGMIPYIGPEQAEDITQSFFLKMYERDLLENRPAITGRFRDWLYIAARRHAIDEWRKSAGRRLRRHGFEKRDPAAPHEPEGDDAPFDVDEFYALSVLHMTVQKVRRHLVEEGKSEHWMIFEELVLAPLIPGRATKTRAEVLAMFPGQGPEFLDNRLTTVKRVFRRILHAVLPADPTERSNPDLRLRELLEILHASKKNHLWLAFLTDPAPRSDASPGTSLDLAARAVRHTHSDTTDSPDIRDEELRILMAFWLEMPLDDYLDDLESLGPVMAGIIRDSRGCSSPGRRRSAGPPLNLRRLIGEVDSTIPPGEMTGLLERLKTFAKRAHRSLRHGRSEEEARGERRLDSAVPAEVAQALYDLSGALALSRCGTRIIGLTDDRFRKNLNWALDQPWIDAKLRTVLRSALKRLDVKRTS
jgi:hypothetical protein